MKRLIHVLPLFLSLVVPGGQVLVFLSNWFLVPGVIRAMLPGSPFWPRVVSPPRAVEANSR